MNIQPRWIALEGPDGCGKSTQARLLAERLDATLVREPGGTPLAEKVRELLLADDLPPMDVQTELLLMMAARRSLYDDVVRPSLEAARGTGIVVSDRSILSSLVYQGLLRGMATWDILRAHEPVIPVLPVSLVLDVRPEVLASRRGDGHDRIERYAARVREQLTEGYRSMADRMMRESDAARIVDGNGTPEEVHGRVHRAALGFLSGAGQTRATPQSGVAPSGGTHP